MIIQFLFHASKLRYSVPFIIINEKFTLLNLNFYISETGSSSSLTSCNAWWVFELKVKNRGPSYDPTFSSSLFIILKLKIFISIPNFMQLGQQDFWRNLMDKRCFLITILKGGLDMETNVFLTSYFHSKTFNYAQKLSWNEMISGYGGRTLITGCWEVQPVKYWF